MSENITETNEPQNRLAAIFSDREPLIVNETSIPLFEPELDAPPLKITITNNLIYDPAAEQTFKFDITENGEKFETAHVYKPLSEERYIKFVKSIDISGDEKDEEDNVQSAGVSLWKDLIKDIENIEVEDGTDFRQLVDVENEIIPSINLYLAVAVVEPEKTTTQKRKLGAKTTQVITTEAFFNGLPVQQTHVLFPKTDELSKKYDRIQKRQFKQETTKGLRRKAKITYVPQDESKGALYGEMLHSATGFGDFIPLRFKTAVIDYVFASTLDPKK